MVGQLDRSKARRRLTALCSNLIRELLEATTNQRSAELELHSRYKTACRVALGVCVEALIGQKIHKSATEVGAPLSLFRDDLDTIHFLEGKESNSKASKALIQFINRSRKSLSEEDLGGIAELFSGHKASWEDNELKLIHNPQRRDIGKIYTPFDVTNHMSSMVVKHLISKANTPEDLFDLRVLDPAVGSGAFCSQIVRNLWKSARRKWKLTDENQFRIRVCEDMIHACDIDEQAIELSKVVLWISAGCPEDTISLNFSLCDSLAAGPCENATTWIQHTGLDCGAGYDAVFGNPPYVRVKPDQIANFETRNARNIFSAFSELSINLLNDTGLFCFIVPQSIVCGNETSTLREFLFQQDVQLRFQIFDSVPDFLFDQGKIELNTNTNINQRTTIVTLDKNRKKSIYTSPLLRWRRTEERNDLFRSLNQIRIRQTDVIDGIIPMLENKDDLLTFRSLSKVKPKLSNAMESDGKLLYLPKAIRYFITAIPIDLERPNTIELKVNRELYPTVHMILNSNVFYWWWRVYGNGFQLEKKDIVKFPLLPIDPKIAEKYSKKLDAAIDECRVFKHNAGKQIPNINYNYRQDILKEIDALLLESIGLIPHARIFTCKSNSLRGKMDALRGYNTQ